MRTMKIMAAALSLAAMVQAADYDGDGIDDISTWDGTDWNIDLAYNGFHPYGTPDAGGSVYVQTGYDQAAPGDYDGDGKTDIALKFAGNGEWVIDYAYDGLAGSSWAGSYGGWGADTNYIPVPGDYDGDGTTDLAVYHYDYGWYIDYSGNGFNGGMYSPSDADEHVQAPFGYRVHPVAADFDGDGIDDLAVKDDAGTGTWYIDYSNNGWAGYWNWDEQLSNWGGPQSYPAAADYDGDGKADIAVAGDMGYYGNTEWYIDYASDGFASYFWNDTHAATSSFVLKPAPGDYDGDGYADLAGKFFDPDGYGAYYPGVFTIDYYTNYYGYEDEWLSGWGGDDRRPLHKERKPVAREDLSSRLESSKGHVTFGFKLSKPSDVRVTAYTLKGDKVATLFEGRFEKGENQVGWNKDDLTARGLKSGLYFLSLEANGYKTSKRLAFTD